MRIRGVVLLCVLVCAAALVWQSRRTKVEELVPASAPVAFTTSAAGDVSDPALPTPAPRGIGGLRLDGSTSEREALNAEPEAELRSYAAEDGCLLEAFDGVTGKRIEGRLNVTLIGSYASSDDGERVRLISGKLPPILLPREHAGRSLEITRMGYARLEASFAPEEERLRVNLIPKRKLKVQLAAETGQGRDFEVSTLDAKGNVLRRKTCSASGRVFFVLGLERETHVRVALGTQLGRAMTLIERKVVLNLEGDTQARVELPKEMTAGKTGSLTVRLTFAEPVELRHDWQLSLRFLDGKRPKLGRAFTPVAVTQRLDSSQEQAQQTMDLDDLEELDPALAYGLGYSAVRPGKYQVLLQPLGLLREILVEADRNEVCLLDLPKLTRVLLRPVMTDGGPHDDYCNCGVRVFRRDGSQPALFENELSGVRVSRTRWGAKAPLEQGRNGALWEFPWEPGVPLELSWGNEGVFYVEGVSSHTFDPLTVTPRGDRFLVDLRVREE